MSSSIIPFKALKSANPPRETVPVGTSTKASRLNFYKYFKPNVFLAYKKKNTASIFTNNQKILLSAHDLSNKYFGKKVRYISQSLKAIAAVHHYKYLQGVAFTEEYNKKSKSINTYPAFKSLGSLIILDKEMTLTEKDVVRLISACCCKTSVRFDNCINIEKWSRAKGTVKSAVKHLKMNFKRLKSLSSKKKLLLGFTNLISLEFCELRTFKNPSSILPDLFGIKTLKSLKLDLSQTYTPKKTLMNILRQLEEHNIPRWHIKVDWSDKDTVKYIDFVLQLIDCLSINLDQEEDCEKHPYYSAPKFSELGYLTKKRKKILELELSVSSGKFAFEPILSSCKSLESLYINVYAYDAQLTFEDE